MPTKKVIYDIGSDGMRETILRRLKELGVTRYQLAHSGLVSVEPASVFRYLSGQNDTKGEIAGEILSALNIGLKAGPRPEWAKKKNKKQGMNR